MFWQGHQNFSAYYDEILLLLVISHDRLGIEIQLLWAKQTEYFEYETEYFDLDSEYWDSIIPSS